MQKKWWVVCVGFLIIILILRLVLFFGNTPTFKKGDAIAFSTRILKEPESVRRRQKITLFYLGSRFSILVPQYPQFQYGDFIYISGVVHEAKISRNSAVATISMMFPRIEKKSSQNDTSLALGVIFSLVSHIRASVFSLFHEALPAPLSSLLLGIVFGIEEGMEQSFKQNLRATGVVHVVAASGMNVSMVGGFLSLVTSLFFRRQIAIAATLAGIIIYAFLSGLDPSIVRASLMGGFAFTAQMLGRQMMGLYALVFSGYIMLLVAPVLLFDIGFQLSFASTLGIVCVMPLLGKLGPFGRLGIKETLSAQIATMPILLSTFGAYSLISILANALLLWTIPHLMILGGVGALIGVFIKPLGIGLLWLALPFLFYFETVVTFLGSPAFVWHTPSFPWQVSVGYYLLLFAFLLTIRGKKP